MFGVNRFKCPFFETVINILRTRTSRRTRSVNINRFPKCFRSEDSDVSLWDQGTYDNELMSNSLKGVRNVDS